MRPKPLVILLIEDNPGDARLIQKYLKVSSKYVEELIHANRLRKGFDVLESKPVDAILLDLNLPDSHGEKTFDLIFEKFSHIPIIILTGIGDNEIATKVVRKGAQDFLVKGDMNYELLKHAIRYAIERKQKENFDQIMLQTRLDIIEYSSNHTFKESAEKRCGCVRFEIRKSQRSSGCDYHCFEREALFKSKSSSNGGYRILYRCAKYGNGCVRRTYHA